MRADVPSLRSKKVLRELRNSWRRACERGEFRIVHYSLQRNHAHLIVEAQGRQALSRGMKSAAARLARAVNRAHGRRGPVLDGRFHHRVLRTPREVRNGLAYVLLNIRKQWAERYRGARRPLRLEEASSGRWFDGWRGPPAGGDPPNLGEDPEVAPPRSWLLRVGWRRHGRIDPTEVPGFAGAR